MPTIAGGLITSLIVTAMGALTLIGERPSHNAAMETSPSPCDPPETGPAVRPTAPPGTPGSPAEIGTPWSARSANTRSSETRGPAL